MPVFLNWLLMGKPLGEHSWLMSKNRMPITRIALQWLRHPQPRSGVRLVDDADARRAAMDLDAVRARFPDHA